MKLPWFFATTPTPRRSPPERRQRPANYRPLARWAIRLVEHFVLWGERSRRRHSGSESLI